MTVKNIGKVPGKDEKQKEVSLGTIYPLGGGDRGAGGAAKPADHHGFDGGHHDDRAAGRNHGGRPTVRSKYEFTL